MNTTTQPLNNSTTGDNAMTEDLDMDWITAQIIERTGVSAYVEQTGGGCATIYVGTLDDEWVPPFMVGPGWFDGPNWTQARGHLEDFCWGDGEGDVAAYSTADDTPETVVAKIIHMMTELEVK
jgi:hypothetical protein